MRIVASINTADTSRMERKYPSMRQFAEEFLKTAKVYGFIGENAVVRGYVGYGAKVYGYVAGGTAYGYLGECSTSYGYIAQGAMVNGLVTVNSGEIVHIGKGDLRSWWQPALKLLWNRKAYDKIVDWLKKRYCWYQVRKEFAKLPRNEQDEIIDTLKRAEEKLGITGYLEELTKEVRDE